MDFDRHYDLYLYFTVIHFQFNLVNQAFFKINDEIAYSNRTSAWIQGVDGLKR